MAEQQTPEALDLEFATLRAEDKATFDRRLGPTGFGRPITTPHVDSVADQIAVTALGGICGGFTGGILDLALYSGFRIAHIDESAPAQIILAVVPIVLAAAAAGVAFVAEWRHSVNQRIIMHARGSQRFS